MKQFLSQYRNSILAQAVYSSAILSISLYIILRIFSHDFPMSWMEEIILFIRVAFTGIFMMVLTTIGCAGIYMAVVRMKRSKKTV